MLGGRMLLAQARAAEQLLPESPGLIRLLIAAAALQLRHEEVRDIDECLGTHDEGEIGRASCRERV